MSAERRFHPRFNTDLPVAISFADDNSVLEGCAINLSLSGLQVQVDKAVADSISDICQHPTEFYVSIDAQDLTIKRIKVRLIINRRISNQEFQLGLKFFSPSQEQLNNLNSFFQKYKKQ